MYPFEVIGEYHPKVWNKYEMCKEISVLFGVGVFAVDVRSPEWHSRWLLPSYLDPPSREWHQDNGGRRGGLYIWSNKYPTEVRYKSALTKEWIYPVIEPFQFVKLANHLCVHKSPLLTPAEAGERWFARFSEEI